MSLRMSPIAVARQPHHLPGRAVDRQRYGAGEAALRIETDGVRGIAGRGLVWRENNSFAGRDSRSASAAAAASRLADRLLAPAPERARREAAPGRAVARDGARRPADPGEPVRTLFLLPCGVRLRFSFEADGVRPMTIRCGEPFAFSSREQAGGSPRRAQAAALRSRHAARLRRREGYDRRQVRVRRGGARSAGSDGSRAGRAPHTSDRPVTAPLPRAADRGRRRIRA